MTKYCEGQKEGPGLPGPSPTAAATPPAAQDWRKTV